MVTALKEVSLIEWQRRYQNEEDCRKRLFELRWPQGFVCPRCQGKDYHNLPKRQLF